MEKTRPVSGHVAARNTIYCPTLTPVLPPAAVPRCKVRTISGFGAGQGGHASPNLGSTSSGRGRCLAPLHAEYENLLAAGAPNRTPTGGSLQRSPDPLAGGEGASFPIPLSASPPTGGELTALPRPPSWWAGSQLPSCASEIQLHDAI